MPLCIGLMDRPCDASSSKGMMAEKARERIRNRFLEATTTAQADAALDEYLDCELLATEWDAERWGFDPDRWMEQERVDLARGGVS